MNRKERTRLPRGRGDSGSWGGEASGDLGFLGRQNAEPRLLVGECSGQDRLKTSEPSARDQNCPGRSLGWCLSFSKNMKNHKEKSRRILGLEPTTTTTRSFGLRVLFGPCPSLALPPPSAHVGAWHLTSEHPRAIWKLDAHAFQTAGSAGSVDRLFRSFQEEGCASNQLLYLN